MAVLEELGSKLTDIAGIKVTFPVQNDKDFILKIYARLCLMYDETWDFDDASFPLSCKKILRLLNRVGIAHLTPTAADVVEPRRLPRVWSAFLSHLEQKYGSQGLYPRLRKVLKQQQILAARREAERERQQRMAGSAHSPGKSQLGDVSTCSSSALSQGSQEDVRFAKPRPPVLKVRHASASPSRWAASPSKGGVRSRIPVPTSLRPNIIPTGKQLARTPRLPAKSAAPPAAAAASACPPHMVQVFGSPRLVAPKAAAALTAGEPAAGSPAPRDRFDSGVSESASSTDVSPGRRRSLIPAAKTPEQALGEYIESRLNAGFPRSAETDAEPTAAAASPESSTAVPVPATAETTLNVTYSAERPAPTPRAAEQTSSPAADAREAILRAAQDSADVSDKENVRPAETGPVTAGKPAGKTENPEAPARGVRRGTFEVTPTPEVPEKSGDGDASSGVPVEQPVGDVVHKSGKKETDKTAEPAAMVTSAPESGTVTETQTASVPDTPVNHTDLPPAQPAQEPFSAPAEKPAGKRRGRAKKDAHEPGCSDAKVQQEAQPEAPKKRGARAKKAKASSQDPVPTVEVPPATEVAPARANSAKTTHESTADVPKTEAPKKRGGRARKTKEAYSEGTPSDGLTAASEGDATAQPGTDADKTEVAAEAHPAQTALATEEPPKKRRGRAKQETKAVVDATDSVPHGAANGAVESESVDPTEVPHESTAKEVPKKRRGRARKNEELMENVPPKCETAPVMKDTPTFEPPEKLTDVRGADAVELVATEQAAPNRRRGRAKETKSAAAAADVPLVTESVPGSAAAEPNEEESHLASEPSEQSAKPVRASRRKTAARTQKSTDSETADDSDPNWTPGAAVSAGGRRGREAAARQTVQPEGTAQEAAAPEPEPAAVRGGGRRTRHTESSESLAAESTQTADPSGSSGLARRATRASTASVAAPAADQPVPTPTATTTIGRRSTRGCRKTVDQDGGCSAEPEPEPARRRRLRVVLESDSEGGTPPAPDRADGSPSPAPLQRARRARKTAEDVSRPRRALRALENCE